MEVTHFLYVFGGVKMKKILLITLITFQFFSLTNAYAIQTSTDYTDDVFTYTITDGIATITGLKTPVSGKLTIPATIGGCPVIKIDTLAFSGDRYITEVVISEGVTTIMWGAFYGSYIGRITLPSTISIIEGYAFYNCSNLKRVYINDIESWCNIDFEDAYANPLSCDVASLYLYNKLTTSITIPNTIKTIKKYSFYMSFVRTVNMSDSVEVIEDQAFYSCRNLTSITLSKNLKSIGKQSFYNSGIMRLYIPDEVEIIGDKAFALCADMYEVRVPPKIKEIHDSAFYDCLGLVNVALPKSIKRIGSCAFYNCKSLKNIFYAGSQTEYQDIVIGSYNTYLTSARTFYNCPSSGNWKAIMSVENCSYNDNELKYKVKIVPRTYFSGTFIIATYTKDNRLLDVDTTSFQLASTDDVTIQNTIPVSSKPYKYKIFLLDNSSNTLKPLTNHQENVCFNIS